MPNARVGAARVIALTLVLLVVTAMIAITAAAGSATRHDAKGGNLCTGASMNVLVKRSLPRICIPDMPVQR